VPVLVLPVTVTAVFESAVTNAAAAVLDGKIPGVLVYAVGNV
jgi:hypothetical protein